MAFYKKLITVFLPLGYFYISRIKKIQRLLWWLSTYFFPIIIFSSFLESINIVYNVCSFILFNMFYEFGYLYNDFITSKRESNPTLRISPELHRNLAENLHAIVIVKFFLLIISVSIFLNLYLDSLSDVYYSFMVFVIFLVHNSLRGRVNIMTFFALYFAKGNYLLFINEQYSLINILFVLIFFSLPKTIEYSFKNRFSLWKNAINIDEFRFYYYAFIFLIVFLVSFYIGDFRYVVIPLIYIVAYLFFTLVKKNRKGNVV